MVKKTTTPAWWSLALCDSRYALQRLAHASDSESTTAKARPSLREMSELEHTTVFRWILADAGIDGNTQANKLAQTAYSQLTRVKVPPDPRHLGSDLQQFLKVKHLKAFGKSPPLLSSLPRCA